MTTDEWEKLIATLRDSYGDDLVDRAMKREASMTKYGWRVAYDPALDGEYELENGGRAYWPKVRNGRLWCRCRWGRRREMCSHVLAVIIQGACQDPNVAATILMKGDNT